MCQPHRGTLAVVALVAFLSPVRGAPQETGSDLNALLQPTAATEKNGGELSAEPCTQNGPSDAEFVDDKPKGSKMAKGKKKPTPKPNKNGETSPDDDKNEKESTETGSAKSPYFVWTREKVIEHINSLPEALRPRLLAIANSKDQNRLAKLAIDDPDWLMTGMTAARVLTDQKLLAKVASEAKQEGIRAIAVQRITGEDQPSLLKLIEQTKDNRVRGAAVALVKDPALRAKLKADANPAGAAFDKSQADKEAQAILTSKDMGDRMRAVEVAVNVEVLFKCAMEDPDIHLADRAAKRLIELKGYRKEGIDDALIERIALGAKCMYPRRTAIEVVSQATLAKAAEDRDDEIRSAVATRLTDPALLARLARDSKANVRSAAINRLTDTKILQKLATSDPEESVRRSAVQRLDALKGKKK